MTLMSWIGGGLLGLGKLIVLPFAKLNTPTVRPIVRWTLHVLFVAAIAGCLYWLGNAWRLQEVVRAPWAIVRMAWLPLLFGCIYALAWVAWWLWKVATSPDQQPEFPDIHEAWQDGLHALAQAKIDVMQTPVYLLLGGEGNSVTGLTQATGWTWETPLTPRRPSSALRICATHDAIFVDVSNACTSGLYASRLLARPQLQTTSASAAAADDGYSSGGGIATAVATRRTAQRGLELIEQSLSLLETEQTSPAADTETHLDGIRVDEEELAIAEQRLAYVCGLLREARTPYCPANGVVTLIPWEATATQATANRCAVLLDRDLQTINRELQVAAPRLALVTDIEGAVGGAELISRMPIDQRQRRFGVRFPRLASCDVKELPRIVEESVAWMVGTLFPALVYRVLRMTTSDDNGGDWPGNTRIFGLANLVRQRQARLLRVLQRGVLPSLEGAPLDGLYFSANSSENAGQQAFVSGVLPQLLEMQNDVAWSPAAIDSDRRARRWTVIGYVVLAAIITGLIAAALSA
jgi:hypothetical protein